MNTSRPALPDLCKPARLALVMGVAELMVVLLFLSPSSATVSALEFIYASFLALWVALSIAVSLCLLTPRMARWPVAAASLLAIALSAAMGSLAMWAMFALDRGMGTHLVPSVISSERFVLGGGSMAALLTAVVLRYLHVVGNWQDQVLAAGHAQAQALQARIRPHFLFNSMNTIAALVRSQPAVAENAILDLSDLFRAALGAGDKPSSLREEVDLAKQYLAIEQLRMGSKLTIQWVLPDQLPGVRLPRLVLQPLVENAVLHGVGRLVGGGEIALRIEDGEDEVRLFVDNPVPEQPPTRDLNQHAGHALESTRARLQYMHGSRANMESWQDEAGYHVVIRAPKDR